VQISSDALRSYVDAVELALFGDRLLASDKIVRSLTPWRRPIRPPKAVSQDRIAVAGSPDFAHISTSLIERQNLTMRMSMRQFTRLTNGFSKKIEDPKAAQSLHIAHYNFVRLHRSLRIPPTWRLGSRIRCGL
jgi:hypothetical protein